MDTSYKPLTERLSDWKIVSALMIAIVVVGFFFANFLLHFFQQVLQLIERFSNQPENFSFESFSVDWHYFFIFQQEWMNFYIGFYIVIAILVVR